MEDNLNEPTDCSEEQRCHYSTLDEIEFLNDMPRLTSIRIGGKESPRKQTDSQMLTQYRQYLTSYNNRNDWGDIDKKKVLAHCKKLMLKHVRRVHKTGYN